jgi:hypothetical protein
MKSSGANPTIVSYSASVVKIYNATSSLLRFEMKKIFYFGKTLWSALALCLYVNSEVVELAPGVEVMITIFCDFQQFSAKKLAFLSKNNVMIQILHNLALFRVKNANFFAEFFDENILKIITSVPEPGS